MPKFNELVNELDQAVRFTFIEAALQVSSLPVGDKQVTTFDTKDPKVKVALGVYHQWQSIVIDVVFEQRPGMWFKLGDFVGDFDRCAQGNAIMNHYGLSECSERYDDRFSDVWNNPGAVIAFAQELAEKLAVH